MDRHQWYMTHLFPDVIQKNGCLFFIHHDWSVICVSWRQRNTVLHSGKENKKPVWFEQVCLLSVCLVPLLCIGVRAHCQMSKHKVNVSLWSSYCLPFIFFPSHYASGLGSDSRGQDFCPAADGNSNNQCLCTLLHAELRSQFGFILSLLLAIK